VVDTTGYQFTTVHIKVRDRSNEQGASRSNTTGAITELLYLG